MLKPFGWKKDKRLQRTQRKQSVSILQLQPTVKQMLRTISENKISILLQL